MPMETTTKESRPSIPATEPMTSHQSPESDGDNKAVADWPSVACGAAAAIGVAWAAAYVTIKGVDRDVGIAAWVAAAVVGASATISAAKGPLAGRPSTSARSRLLSRLARRSKLKNAED